MPNGKPTISGLHEKIIGLEKLMNQSFKTAEIDRSEIKQMFRVLQKNQREELYPIRQDIEILKRGYWKLAGGLTVVFGLFEFFTKVLKW